MSRKTTSFTEKMAKYGYDPRGLHPELAPPTDDDRGHGSEDDEFLAELMKDEPPVAAPERPWYDRDG